MPHKKPSFGLVPDRKLIWEGSIVFLVLLLSGMLLFDGYIFFGKVQQLQSVIYDASVENSIESIRSGPLNQAREILEKRASALEHSGDNLSVKNPFKP